MPRGLLVIEVHMCRQHHLGINKFNNDLQTRILIIPKIVNNYFFMNSLLVEKVPDFNTLVLLNTECPRKLQQQLEMRSSG